MITVIGILVGAIIIALVWICVYFNQEIHDVMAEMRARDGGYYHTPYKVNYSRYYDGRYADVPSERDEYKNRYDSLKKSYDECLKRCAELERELDRGWEEDELGVHDDELDN